MSIRRFLWAVPHYLRAVRDNPRGWRCGWCGSINLMFDEIGWFYTLPHGGDDSRPCCERCWNGPVGDMHRVRYGVGER